MGVVFRYPNIYEHSIGLERQGTELLNMRHEEIEFKGEGRR